MNNSNNKRVAIYIRVSTVHQKEKLSIPMQRKDLAAYCNAVLDTDDYEIFEDAGYSGKNTQRPEFQKMMSRIRAGEFTHLLVWKIDRISRNLLDFAHMYDELKKLNVVFVSKNEQFDTSSAMGEAMLKIILIFAELERNMTSERVTATMISKANDGNWNGGRVPFGYHYDKNGTKLFSIIESEAEVVHLIHDKYEELSSIHYTMTYLNSNGVRTRSGKQWSITSLSVILNSRFYTGDYEYNIRKEGNRQKKKDDSEHILIRDHHPQIISREQKERIISMLSANRKVDIYQRYKKFKNPHVFSGLLKCADCGVIYSSRTGSVIRDGWNSSRYICKTRYRGLDCSAKATSDTMVGEFAINYILNIINAHLKIKSIDSTEQLQHFLLAGKPFSHISSIDSDGLNDLYNTLCNLAADKNIFEIDLSDTSEEPADSNITFLKAELQKNERALDRLKTLYLFSEDSMSEQEYVAQKYKLTEKISELHANLDLAQSESDKPILTDRAFIQKASHFILMQNLSGRNYVMYKRLAQSVEPEVIKSFFNGIIDHMVIKDGKIQKIVFLNGLSHTFTFK